MINPYILRNERDLYFVLSEDSCQKQMNVEVQKSILIVINLYYLDSLERYFKYLKCVPNGIKIIVISSKDAVLDKVMQYCKENNLYNIEVRRKNNRGRDISAFLVACREEILKYQYFCFVHDKKANKEHYKEDIDFWIDNLWNNVLKNENYINNVISTFENNRKLGILTPPEPIGEYVPHWYLGKWGNETNYENVKKLAKRMQLNCNIDKEYPPITLGTVFWCRTCALKKLLEIEWKYEDFNEEPLQTDGTLSHAIERIFSFVAQDAGYETGTVMCNSYVQKLISKLQIYMNQMYVTFNEISMFSVYDMHDVKSLEIYIRNLKKFFYNNREVYLYGAGKVGRKFLSFLRTINLEIKGFVISEKSVLEEVDGVPIFSLEQLCKKENIGIIVTIGKIYEKEVVKNLKEIGFNNYMMYYK